MHSEQIGHGAEWLFCTCERWLHEDCAEDIVDNDGNGMLLSILCSLIAFLKLGNNAL